MVEHAGLFAFFLYPFFYIYLFFPRENIPTTLSRFITLEKISAFSSASPQKKIPNTHIVFIATKTKQKKQPNQRRFL